MLTDMLVRETHFEQSALVPRVDGHHLKKIILNGKGIRKRLFASMVEANFSNWAVWKVQKWITNLKVWVQRCD